MRLDQDSPLYFIKRENKCNNNIIYIIYIYIGEKLRICGGMEEKEG